MNSLRHGESNAQFFEPGDIDFDGVFHCSTYIGVSEVVIVRYFVLFIRFQGAEGARYFPATGHKV